MNDKSIQNNTSNGTWSTGKGWDSDRAYGELFYKRATGELAEMESSKAAARRLAPHLTPNDRLLDVGCGAGHYLRSLRQAVATPFHYTGVDLSEPYVELGRKAFDSQANVEFHPASVFELPFVDGTFDLAMCNNVLLHLPSIEKPLAELCRVARRRVLIRTLVGERSFRTQEVRSLGDEFDETGEPREFNWYNIWSRSYIEHRLSKLARVRKFTIEPDRDFDPTRIESAAKDNASATNATRMFGDWQVNGYILQPWCFIEIELKP